MALMERIIIVDTAIGRTGTILAYDGSEATVQWHTHWYVTGVTKAQLESGRYHMKGK
jgi:hypothetical protein